MDRMDLAATLGVPTSRLGAQHLSVAHDVPEHTHTFIEVAFVLGGRAIHRSARRTQELTRGSLVVIRPGTWHAYEAIDDLEVINLYLSPELFHRELAWVLDYPVVAAALLPEGESSGLLSDSSMGRAAGWLDQLEALAGRTVPTAFGLATSALGELIEADLGAGSEQRPPISPAVRRAMEVMQDDLRLDWTIERLAREVRVSPSSLHRLFRRELGRAPLTWLTQTRGERAASLLAATDLAIARIGTDVGWADPSYASRRFRQLYGITPSAYRSRFARG